MILAGRGRWKIENEGFNVQKNGTFDIGICIVKIK